MTVTLKWIVSSLLYDNGHLLLMEIFQYAVHQFCQEEHHEYPRSASTADINPARQFTRSESSADYSQPPQVQQHSSPPLQQYQQQQEYRQQEHQTHYDTEDGNKGDESEDEEEEEESENEDDLVPVEDYLTENPEVDAGKFEQLWSTSAVV